MRKTIDELLARALIDFPDNTSGLITPVILRQFFLDFLEGILPTYAALSSPAPQVRALTTVDAPFPWTTQVIAQPPDYTTNLANGMVTRANGPAVAEVHFAINFRAANNRTPQFTLYVDGVPTPWTQGLTATGMADMQSVSFSAVTHSLNANPTFQIRAKVDVNANVTLLNAQLAVKSSPITFN